jgi:hypothetical protein
MRGIYALKQMEKETEATVPMTNEDSNEDDVPKKAPVEMKKSKVDYKKYRPYFLHVPAHKIKKTFKQSTQYATNVMAGRNIRQTIKSPFPAHNVHRRNEPMATDTIFSETPAVDGGETMAQFYCGRKSLVIDIYGMGSSKEFVNTLLDNIQDEGSYGHA